MESWFEHVLNVFTRKAVHFLWAAGIFISSKRPSKLMPERDKKEGRKVKFAIEPGLLPSRNGGTGSAQKNKEASDVCTSMQ